MKHLFTISLCFLTLSLTAQETCPNVFDYDNDGNVAVNDFLAMLGYFGDTDADSDGVWDSEDECVGDYDECGVCNGIGIPEGFCTCTESVDVLNVCGGDCIADLDDDGICDEFLGPCYGDSLLYQGYWYGLIEIGNQCWFSENLLNTNYANGDLIMGDLSVNDWNTQMEGAWAVYDDDVTNLSLYGRLYNWYATIDSRGLCPTGWHVPADEEFMTLEIELGMGAGYASSAGNRGQEQNLKLKSSPNDYPAWDGNNSSGFSGLPGGYRVHGNYDYPDEAYFWSTTINSSNLIWYRSLNPTGIMRNHAQKTQGKSARCVRD